MRKRFTIHITRMCNMDCSYCYERDKISGHLTNEELAKNIDSIFEREEVTPELKLEIEFLGGEPLLNIGGLQFCCNYIKTKYSEYTICKLFLTTNGAIYSDEIAKMLKDNKMFIVVSIDGNKDMHNSCRFYKHSKKGTYDKVIENTLKYRQYLNVLIQCTVHKYNVGYIFEGVQDLYAKGFNVINLGVVKSTADNEFYEEFINQHRKIINYLNNGKLNKLKLFPMMQENFKLRHQKETLIKNNSSFLDVYEETTLEALKESDERLYKYYSCVKSIIDLWKIESNM